MMAHSSTQRVRRLRRALHSSRAHKLTPRARTLAQAVWSVPSAPDDHARCLDELPAYVNAEIESEPPNFESSFVHRHLLICVDCELVYSDLLELSRVESQSLLPHINPPDPDLSFLGGLA